MDPLNLKLAYGSFGHGHGPNRIGRTWAQIPNGGETKHSSEIFTRHCPNYGAATLDFNRTA